MTSCIHGHVCKIDIPSYRVVLKLGIVVSMLSRLVGSSLILFKHVHVIESGT